MEKRELSSTLRNLKFMQRVAQKEEKTKKVDVDQEVIESSATLPSSVTSRKCIVILEGDPHPGSSMTGRMSFQNFNPSIDKLNQEPTEVATNSSSTNQTGKTSSEHHRDSNSNADNGSDEEKKKKKVTQQPNAELKRKQIEGEVSEPQHPNKSPKIDQQHSSQKNHSSGSSKKREKLDWNVLRPPSKRTN